MVTEIIAKRIWANSAYAVQIKIEGINEDTIYVLVSDYEQKIYSVSKKDVLDFMVNGNGNDDYDPEYIECYYALTKEAKESAYYEYFKMARNILKDFD